MNRIVNVKEFDENFSANIPNDGVPVVLFTFVVPPKCIVRIKKFANYTGTPAAVGAGLSWQINRNGIGLHRYDNILDIIGMSYHPEEIQTDEFKGSDILTLVTINNYAVGAVQSGVRIVFDLEGT